MEQVIDTQQRMYQFIENEVETHKSTIAHVYVHDSVSSALGRGTTKVQK